MKTIFVSKVVDTSFDLPDANILIQILMQAIFCGNIPILVQ